MIEELHPIEQLQVLEKEMAKVQWQPGADAARRYLKFLREHKTRRSPLCVKVGVYLTQNYKSSLGADRTCAARLLPRFVPGRSLPRATNLPPNPRMLTCVLRKLLCCFPR